MHIMARIVANIMSVMPFRRIMSLRIMSWRITSRRITSRRIIIFGIDRASPVFICGGGLHGQNRPFVERLHRPFVIRRKRRVRLGPEPRTYHSGGEGEAAPPGEARP